MPFVGGGAEDSTTYVSTIGPNAFGVAGVPTIMLNTVSYNASEYSHSTVFVTSAADDSSLTSLNAPPLMKIYTPPTACAERWMLAGSQEVTVTRRIPTMQPAYPTVLVTSMVTVATPGGVSPLVATSTLGVPTSQTIVPLITSPASLLPRADFEPQNLTVLSLDLNGTATDPSYRSCQPYGSVPTYSPGICPYGQTAAEITAWQVNTSTGFHTFWQASCCRRFVARASFCDTYLRNVIVE